MTLARAYVNRLCVNTDVCQPRRELTPKQWLPVFLYNMLAEVTLSPNNEGETCMIAVTISHSRGRRQVCSRMRLPEMR